MPAITHATPQPDDTLLKTLYDLDTLHDEVHLSCNKLDFICHTLREMRSLFADIETIYHSYYSRDTSLINAAKKLQNEFDNDSHCLRHASNCFQVHENHVKPQATIIDCTIEEAKFRRILDPSLNEYTPRSNQIAYEQIYSKITSRYADFNHATESGYRNSNGITSHIEGISKKSLIGALMHIRDNECLLKECRSNSRSAPFFDKFYLMSNQEQGWNLRLHFFNAKSNGLGGEDSPHYHRWTLASWVVSGGYCNRNYREEETANHSSQHIYDKYQLAPTGTQGASDSRNVQLLGQKAMIPVKAEIYDRDSLNHFPIAMSHSVQTMPDHFGSTVTLAHTAKSQHANSFSFKKTRELGDNLNSLPEKRADNDPKFNEKLDNAIVTLQILKLQDELKSIFEMKWENGGKLTQYECEHQYDSYERNYVETSLLSALAIYKMEKANNLPHREFSSQTVEFLDKSLACINQAALDRLIETNQANIAEGLFSVEVFSSNEQLMSKFDQQFIDGLDRRS